MMVIRKRFGQNFLTDPRKADRLVDALKIVKGETVLEIGPGKGILTERILERGAYLIAVEIDRDLAYNLRERFGANERFKLVEDDIIKVNPANWASDNLKVIGNLPYNISGAIAGWLIEYHNVIQSSVVTVQKEVAERLRAEPGSREYGSLTVMVNSFYDVSKLFDIPPGCFFPKPKVVSTSLRLDRNIRLGDDTDYSEFREFLKGCFSQKRKKLVNSLASTMSASKETVEKCLFSLGGNADVRAEQLSQAELLELYKAIKNYA